jgi:hypothetical protein
MTDYIPYPTRMLMLVSRSPLTPAEDHDNRSWEREELEREKAQVQRFAADQSQRALENRTLILDAADKHDDFITDLERQATERRIEPGAAVRAVKEAEQRIEELRRLRTQASDQMAQATYLQERPHEYLDDLYSRYPGIGERPIPPHGQIVRGLL